FASTFARTLRSYAERQNVSLEPAPKKPVKLEIAKKKAPRAIGSPLTSGTMAAKKSVEKPSPEPPAAVKTEIKAQPRPLLLRAWSWLQKNHKFAATKQLRVAETVSLGEKRFVSLIDVDGQKFLIGGGPAGVSLLAQLGTAPASVDVLRALAGAVEQS